jgi:hypothetical protein
MDPTPAAQPTEPLPPVMPAPARTARRRGFGIGAVGAAVAGLLLVIAGFLPWVTASIQLPSGRFAAAARGLSRSVRGFRTSDGRILLGLGGALLVLALAAWLGRAAVLRLHAAVLALAAGGVALTVGIYDLAANLQTPAELAGLARRLPRLAQHATIGISKGAGLWLVLIGGIVAVAAAAAEVVGGVRAGDRAVPAAPPPPAPGAGPAGPPV